MYWGVPTSTSAAPAAPAAAPPAPDSGNAATLAIHVDRKAHNTELFDAAWSRATKLYFSAPGDDDRRGRWEAIRTEYRPRARAAKTNEELAGVVHEMLRRRPPLRESATGRAAAVSARNGSRVSRYSAGRSAPPGQSGRIFVYTAPANRFVYFKDEAKTVAQEATEHLRPQAEDAVLIGRK